MPAAERKVPEKPRFCRDRIERVLLTAEEIAARVAELGEQITRDYEKQPPLLIGVLQGACVFLSDLMRQVDLPCRVDFVAVGSYGDGTMSSGEITLRMEPAAPLRGERVLVVEDIVDTGRTLQWLVRRLSREAEDVRVCCLLDKPSRREVEGGLDYVGFAIPDHFVVGYGLDVGQQYRNLPYVAVLKPDLGRPD